MYTVGAPSTLIDLLSFFSTRQIDIVTRIIAVLELISKSTHLLLSHPSLVHTFTPIHILLFFLF
jgi:hypothetical protein